MRDTTNKIQWCDREWWMEKTDSEFYVKMPDFKLLLLLLLLSLQSCPTLCDPIDSSPQGSPVPGILQARTLEWVAISFSNAWMWKVKVKSLRRVQLLSTPWTAQPTRLPRPWDFPGKSTGVGCHCLLLYSMPFQPAGTLETVNNHPCEVRCPAQRCHLYKPWANSLIS